MNFRWLLEKGIYFTRNLHFYKNENHNDLLLLFFDTLFYGVYRTENIKELRRNALIFDYLCQASSQLNDIFSVPVLFVLILKFLTVISTAFVFFYRFTYSNVILENSKFIPPLIFILEWIRMLIIFTAADMPVIQVMFSNFSFQIYYHLPRSSTGLVFALKRQIWRKIELRSLLRMSFIATGRDFIQCGFYRVKSYPTDSTADASAAGSSQIKGE